MAETRLSSLVEFKEDGQPVVPFRAIFPNVVAEQLKLYSVDSFETSEEDIEEHVKPTYLDRKLKKAFWKEFKECDQANKKMQNTNIVFNICTTHVFKARVKSHPLYALWLIAPTIPYNNAMEAYLHVVQKRYSELINMDIHKYKDGERTEDVDVRKASLLLNVIKNIEDRTVGGALQRQISISTSTPETKEGDKIATNVDAINKRLEELAYQLGEKQYIEDNRNIIDVEVE